MKQFDFSDPEKWHFEGVAILYEPSEESGMWDMIDDYIDTMIDENNGNPSNVVLYDTGSIIDLVRKVNPESRFAERFTCDHCGSHFHYGAVYRDNDDHVAVVGHTCATNKLNLTASEYALKRAKAIKAAAKTRARADKIERALNTNRYLALQHNHSITQDMRRRFRERGFLSRKQWELAKKLYNQQREWDREPPEVTAPVVEGKGVKVTGKVLATKWQEGYYDDVLKMLVRDDRGFKVWGSVPSSLGISKGERVEFIANIEVSRDDETFGFFKRPRKAVNLTEAEYEAEQRTTGA